MWMFATAAEVEHLAQTGVGIRVVGADHRQVVAEDRHLREPLGDFAKGRVLVGVAGDAGDEPVFGRHLEDADTFLAVQPGAVLILTQVMGEPTQRPLLRHCPQPVGRARRVVGLRPEAVEIGNLGDPVRILRDLGGDVGVVLRVVVDLGADQEGAVDPVQVHLVQELLDRPP